MLLGTGLAFYLGKPLIQPQAPQLPAIALGAWSDNAGGALGAAGQRAGADRASALAVALWWAFARTRAGLLVRMAGDSANATRALGYSVAGIRIAATTAGGVIAGLGGASLTLFYPGSWNEGISSGQGLIAVALVIFARWSPLRCVGRGAAVRRRRRHRPGAAVDRRRLGLPPVQHRALRADAGDPGAHLQARQVAAGSPGELSSIRSNEGVPA